MSQEHRHTYRAELHTRDLLIEKLKHQLASLRRSRFGSSSEALEQLELTLEEAEIAAAIDPAVQPVVVPAPEKDQPKRRPLPDHLPRSEQVLSPGEACGRCGGKLKHLGEDVTEELEYVPGRFVVNRIVRPRLACAGCERIHQAPLPSRPMERGRPGPGLLPTSWPPNTPTICRCIARARSTGARASTWNGPR